MTIVEESEYQDNPILRLKVHEFDRYPFSFGIRKAKMILECIDDIKKFVDKNDIGE